MSDRWQLIDLPRITDGRGNLTFVENETHLPFKMQRIYYLYDVPENQARAKHAHKNLYQLLIGISGSFQVELDDGYEKQTFDLDRADQGLLVKPMVWRDINRFSPNAICLAIASELYSEDDYYRNYDDFIQNVRKKS